MVSVTVEQQGTMLVGSEIGAALTILEPFGIDILGLNCATGPAEMKEHIKYLSEIRLLLFRCAKRGFARERGRTGALSPDADGAANGADALCRRSGRADYRRLLRYAP